MLYENLHFKAPKLNTSSSDLGVDNMFWQHDNNITDDEHHTILIDKFSQLEENEIMTTINNDKKFDYKKKIYKPDGLYAVKYDKANIIKKCYTYVLRTIRKCGLYQRKTKMVATSQKCVPHF